MWKWKNCRKLHSKCNLFWFSGFIAVNCFFTTGTRPHWLNELKKDWWFGYPLSYLMNLFLFLTEPDIDNLKKCYALSTYSGVFIANKVGL